MKKIIFILALSPLLFTACKKKGCTEETALNYDKKATKNDGACVYPASGNAYSVPTSYIFYNADGNSTVSFSGQTERLDQLDELIAYAETGETSAISAQVLNDMFSNTNNPFSFVSTKQLKNKCFTLDVTKIESYFDSIALSSQNFANSATQGNAGTLTSGTSTYLISGNGFDYPELIEKAIMGSVFMHQALNVYFGTDKMNVDNSTAVDPATGSYYTTMQHHWDEAFGYFGVPLDFPTTAATRFWGKYCNSQNATLGSNAKMMNNFLKGRAAIGAKIYTDRDAAILEIQNTWETITAHQAITYLNAAISFYGTDNAKYFHTLSEAFGFANNIRYTPDAVRNMTITEHNQLMNAFGTNLWTLTLTDLNAIKASIQAKY
jgi:hypothetical protein